MRLATSGTHPRRSEAGNQGTKMLAQDRSDVFDFAKRITELGFAVYIAKSGTYGFITDASESRVLSFAFDGLGGSLSGNYGPPSTSSGTGWRMDLKPHELDTAGLVREALYAEVPAWSNRGGKGWRYLSTVAQYLAHYDSSSHFTQFADLREQA